ncbi:hypothetical protein N9S00_08125 [Luminiphilus sp.]|nr:hypothetical protein [Luminiphilus sp.]
MFTKRVAVSFFAALVALSCQPVIGETWQCELNRVQVFRNGDTEDIATRSHTFTRVGEAYLDTFVEQRAAADDDGNWDGKWTDVTESVELTITHEDLFSVGASSRDWPGVKHLYINTSSGEVQLVKLGMATVVEFGKGCEVVCTLEEKTRLDYCTN